MADREELHEFHVDELGTRTQRERIAVAAHVERSAVARIKARQAAGGDDRRFRRNRDRLSGRRMHRMRADANAVLHREVDDEEVAAAADQAAVDEHNTRVCACGGQRGVHAGSAGTDDQDVRLRQAIAPRSMVTTRSTMRSECCKSDSETSTDMPSCLSRATTSAR